MRDLLKKIEELYLRFLAGGVGMSLTKTISTWPSTSNLGRFKMLLKMVCRCYGGIKKERKIYKPESNTAKFVRKMVLYMEKVAVE